MGCFSHFDPVAAPERWSSPIIPTELSGGLNVDVVVSAADADDDAQRFELLQVLPGQGDGVVHHGPHRLVQHLPTKQDPRPHEHVLEVRGDPLLIGKIKIISKLKK